MESSLLLIAALGLILGILIASIVLGVFLYRKIGGIFSTLAENQLKTMQAANSGEMAQKEKSLRLLVQPLQDSLDRYDHQLRDLERKRETAYGSLHQYLKGVASTQTELRRETSSLVQALQSPNVRGKWGEMSLQRVVELAGLVEHCDFEVQPALGSADLRARPDLIIYLPNDRTIIIDSKVPLDSYLRATETKEEHRKQELLADHARQLRQHVLNLSSKSYWTHLAESPEFVVLYLPLESLYSAALQQDPDLIEKAGQQQVILATPTTLIALLKAVAYGWKQEKVSRNAEEIASVAKEFLERLATFREHFNRLGTSLDRSVEAYNKTLSSLERRVLTQARRLEEMGIAPSKTAGESVLIERRTVGTLNGDGSKFQVSSSREHPKSLENSELSS